MQPYAAGWLHILFEFTRVVRIQSFCFCDFPVCFFFLSLWPTRTFLWYSIMNLNVFVFIRNSFLVFYLDFERFVFVWCLTSIYVYHTHTHTHQNEWNARDHRILSYLVSVQQSLLLVDFLFSLSLSHSLSLFNRTYVGYVCIELCVI